MFCQKSGIPKKTGMSDKLSRKLFKKASPILKSLAVFLLFFIVCISLSACGSNTNEDSNTTSDNSDEVTINDNSVIEFEDVVLIDDDTITIELVNFYAEDYNWAEGSQNEKMVTFKATNNSDHKILVNPKKFYIEDEEVEVILNNGSIVPDPGKSGVYSFIIAHNYTPNRKALESLDDLYNLEGSFDVTSVYDDVYKNNSYEANFSIQNSINGESTDDKDPDIIYNIGDTVSTDVVEFTLTGFDYVYHLNPSTYAEKADNSGGSIGPGTDMVFANPEYTLKNISKESIRTFEVTEFTVDYNNGYLYNMYDKVSYIVDVPGIKRQIKSRGSSSGSTLEISPLSSEDYDSYIPANSLIDTDTTSPLLLIVTLATSSGTQDFIYKIK